jgi:hypothetical protein
MPTTPPRHRQNDWLALAGALALLATLLTAASCGGGDLVFPGDIPATSTSAPTATSTPDN